MLFFLTAADGQMASNSSTMLDQIMLTTDNDPASPEALVKEAAQGHLDVVRDIISRHPQQVSVQCREIPPQLMSMSQSTCTTRVIARSHNSIGLH